MRSVSWRSRACCSSTLPALLLLFALLLLLQTLLVGALFRFAALLLLALLRLLSFPFLRPIALLLARGAIDDRPVDHDRLNRQRRRQRLPRDRDQRETENPREYDVQERRPDQVRPVVA